MTTIAEALAAAGITVYDHRVAPRPGLWKPYGVLWHHVGNTPPTALKVPAPSIRLCQVGRSDLPGPLCQWLIDGAGGWNWITDGRANHAGKGDVDVWRWLRSDPNNRAPNPPRPDDNADTTDGNGHLIGLEVEGNGNWSAKVHESMVTGTRVLADFYGNPRTNLLAHKEWTNRKVDPAGIDMSGARLEVAAPAPQPDPDPVPLPEEIPMDFFIVNDANDATDDQWYWWPELGKDADGDEGRGRRAIIPRGPAITKAKASRLFAGELELDRPDLDAIPTLR